MLSVNVGTLLQQTNGTVKTVAIDDIVKSDKDSYVTKGNIKLSKTSRCIIAEADLTVIGILKCSRCLKEFSTVFPVCFTEEYYTKDHLLAIAREANSDDDLEDWFLIDGRNILDFSEAIRQYCITAEPISPKCSENCSSDLIK